MASKSKRKTKFIWTKEMIILLVCLFAAIVAAILLNLPTSKERSLTKYNEAIETYNSNNSTSYTTLTKDNVYKDISHDSLVSKKASSDYTYVLYGSFEDGTFLDELYKVNVAAKNYDIDLVYLCDSAWYEDEDDKDTVEFRALVKEKETALNSSVDKDQKDFDVSLGTALMVFKDDKLIYNSQTYSSSESSSEYNWYLYVNKALTIGKETN